MSLPWEFEAPPEDCDFGMQSWPLWQFLTHTHVEKLPLYSGRLFAQYGFLRTCVSKSWQRECLFLINEALWGRRNGSFESVLFVAKSGCGGGDQHFQHHLQCVQRFAFGYGERSGHSHRSKAGRWGKPGGGAQCGPEAGCLLRCLLPELWYRPGGISSLFPMIYNTTDAVRGLAGHFIRAGALFMPFCALPPSPPILPLSVPGGKHW